MQTFLELSNPFGFAPPSPPPREIWYHDHLHLWKFRFRACAPADLRNAGPAVYGLANLSDQFGYLGSSVDPSRRLGDHDKLASALESGFTQLLLHEPAPWARWSIHEAEAILISSYQPIFNEVQPALPPEYLPEDPERVRRQRMASFLGLGAIPAPVPTLGALISGPGSGRLF